MLYYEHFTPVQSGPHELVVGPFSTMHYASSLAHGERLNVVTNTVETNLRGQKNKQTKPQLDTLVQMDRAEALGN